MSSGSALHAQPGADDATARLRTALSALDEIIVDKNSQLRLALCCLLAGGHLLIEDVPGVGKTTLAHALARVLGLSYQRIQFTSDLLPADVLGVSVYRRETGRFEFHKGPIFSQLVLADEINRATPKAQSALLEAMEERQVTADGESFDLPAPFFVIATSNPSHQIGTFELPESQLDRFLMRIALGFPGAAAERLLLTYGERRNMLSSIAPAIIPEELVALQARVRDIYLSDAVLDYVQAIIAFTRESGAFISGLSPRAGIALVRASQAAAMIAGHDGVHPEDVQTVLASVVVHRLAASSVDIPDDLGEFILRSVAIP
ncbi:MAG: AAA family ATPase [Gammaproteobacteria bacterium]|jgi:MoxR-like ATPase